MVLHLKSIEKRYASADSEIVVLKDLDLRVAQGDICALVGPSGSGKTSLLGIAAGLEPPTTGSVTLCGTTLDGVSEEQRAALRNKNIGFVFQSFQLIPSLTAEENVMVPAELARRVHARAEARELLVRVGLAGREHHYPNQLSGGEQQRVAIARAFINQPKVLFADEPTGNLDETTAQKVEQLLFDLHEELGTTLIFATHNMHLAQRAKRLFYLEHGGLREAQGASSHVSSSKLHTETLGTQE